MIPPSPGLLCGFDMTLLMNGYDPSYVLVMPYLYECE